MELSRFLKLQLSLLKLMFNILAVIFAVLKLIQRSVVSLLLLFPTCCSLQPIDLLAFLLSCDV